MASYRFSNAHLYTILILFLIYQIFFLSFFCTNPCDGKHDLISFSYVLDPLITFYNESVNEGAIHQFLHSAEKHQDQVNVFTF